MKLLGIDRVVPFGKTTDFDLIWDGYDLIYTLQNVYLIGWDGFLSFNGINK